MDSSDVFALARTYVGIIAHPDYVEPLVTIMDKRYELPASFNTFKIKYHHGQIGTHNVIVCEIGEHGARYTASNFARAFPGRKYIFTAGPACGLQFATYIPEDKKDVRLGDVTLHSAGVKAMSQTDGKISEKKQLTPDRVWDDIIAECKKKLRADGAGQFLAYRNDFLRKAKFPAKYTRPDEKQDWITRPDGSKFCLSERKSRPNLQFFFGAIGCLEKTPIYADLSAIVKSIDVLCLDNISFELSDEVSCFHVRGIESYGGACTWPDEPRKNVACFIKLLISCVPGGTEKPVELPLPPVEPTPSVPKRLTREDIEARRRLAEEERKKKEEDERKKKEEEERKKKEEEERKIREEEERKKREEEERLRKIREEEERKKREEEERLRKIREEEERKKREEEERLRKEREEEERKKREEEERKKREAEEQKKRDVLAFNKALDDIETYLQAGNFPINWTAKEGLNLTEAQLKLVVEHLTGPDLSLKVSNLVGNSQMTIDL